MMGGGIFETILIGLVVGVIARFIKPGADPMGWIMTILFGIGGAFLASFATAKLGIATSGWMTWLAAVIGAVVLLFIYDLIFGKK